MEMDQLVIIATIIWVGSFVVVSIDSVMRGISPIFWRMASLFGGPFSVVAYGIVRELKEKKD